MSTPVKDTRTSHWARLLRNNQFRWLFIGNTMLFCGFAATVLLRSLLAWQLTKDEMALAYINLVTAGCMLLMSFVSGAVVDRIERRKLLLIAQTVILFTDGLILALMTTGHLHFYVLMFSAFVASMTYPYIMPSRTAMLMDAIGRASLSKGNAMMGAGVSVARMTSPAVVGIVADMVGMTFAYILLLAIHCTTIFCAYALEKNWPTRSGESFLNDAKEGFVYMFNHKPLLMCIFFGLLPILIVIPLQNLLVVFVDEVWQQGGSGLGILMAGMGLGGLLGSFVMGMVKDDKLVKPMVLATISLSVFLIMFSNSPSFWLAALLMLGIYCSSVFCQTLVHTAAQLMTDDRVRGRITTITMMTYGLAPLGTLPLAFAAKHIGAPMAMTIAAVLLLLAVAAVWLWVPSFRKIDAAAAKQHQVSV